MGVIIKALIWLLLFVFWTPSALFALLIKLIVYLVSGNKK